MGAELTETPSFTPYDGALPMSAQFPAYANMLSFGTIEASQRTLDEARRYANATEADIVATNVTQSLGIKGNVETHYRLEWTTYRGWKAYMYCTGCLAFDPKHEPPVFDESYNATMERVDNTLLPPL